MIGRHFKSSLLLGLGAVLAMAFLAACSSTDEGITKAELQEALAAAAQPAPAPAGPSAAEISELVSAAVAASAPAGVSSSDIAAAVKTAVESAAGDAVTAADIEALVSKAVEEAISGGPTPLSASQVQDILAAAVAAIPTPAAIVEVRDVEIEVVNITARCRAKPPTEDWRCNNFQFALAEVNAALLAEGDNRQIKLKIIQDNKDWGPYRQEFVLSTDAGNPADIVLSGHEDIGDWATNGLIISLDDFIAGQPGVYDNVIDGLWPSVTFKGERWAVPQDAEARPLFWSKPLLSELGWSEAKIDGLADSIQSGDFTLQDMLAAGKEAIDKGIIEEGFGFQHRPRNGSDFWAFYYGLGGETIDAATGKLVYDRAAGLKQFEFFEDATQNLKVLVPDMFGRSWNDFHTAVSDIDKVLFWLGGSWQWAEWAEIFVKDRGGQAFLFENVGFGLIPAAEAGLQPVTLTHPLAYMISAKSKHPDLAFRLITAVTTDEANTRHAVGSTHLGVLKSQANFPPYVADRLLSEILYMLEFTTFLPNNAKFGIYSNTWFEGMQAVEFGDMTAVEAVDFVIERMKAELGDDVIIR